MSLSTKTYGNLQIRILQLKILNDEDSYQEIFKFIRELKYTVVKNSYVSMIRSGKMLDKMVKLTGAANK